MDKLDFESEDWKKRLKGKSPEEIARIVEEYYNQKYRDEKIFSNRRIVLLVFLCLVFLMIFIFMYILSRAISS